MQARLWQVLLLAAAVHGPVRAVAGVPSAGNSTVPTCLSVCPLGDMPFTVVVRDLANNALNGASVVLDFAACPGAFICPQSPSDPYLVNGPARTIRMFASVTGAATFPARIGGICSGAFVRVFANGTLLKDVPLASPDQNGDGLVLGAVDDASFASKLGTSEASADFNCSGGVDATDAGIFDAHHAHSCTGVVTATPRQSWGRLKSWYR